MSSLPARAVLEVRAAEPQDVSGIVELMAPFVAVGDLLPRTPVDVLSRLESYVVVRDPQRGVVGVGSLKPYTATLAEVQALAVHPAHQGSGVGRAVVERLIDVATTSGVEEIFALTRRPVFFERLGFQIAQVQRFPSKIWLDCARCPRQHACDEIAVHLLLNR